MPYGASDLTFMMADTVGTVAVVFGGQNARGQMEQVGENPEDPGGMRTPVVHTVLLMKTGAFSPAPAMNSQLTIDGTTYKVRGVDLQQDGAVTAYTVARTS